MNDFLGNTLKIGDTVLIPTTNFANKDGFEFAVVHRFLRSRIEVARSSVKTDKHKYKAYYGNQLLRVDAKYHTMYELKKGKSNV